MSKIGAQLYTLRDHLKTPHDMASTFRRVREIGYENVQVSGLGPIEEVELRKMLDSEGLKCVVTHVKMEMMQDTQRCADYHHALGCQYTAIGGFFPKENIAAATYQTFATQYNQVVAALAAKGVLAGYHNHSHELVRFGSQTGLDILLRDCIEQVWFEIDTYWIQHGGGDPAAYIQKVGQGRIPCVHLKDMAITHDRQQKMCEVGAGNLNWPAILSACQAAGVEWYLVERDSGDLDPFESLKISFDNLKAMGLD